MNNARLTRAASAILAALLLKACATVPVEPPMEAAPTQPPQASGPEVVNFTPMPAVLLTCDGACSAVAGQDYYTWNAKLSFDIDARGRLVVSQQQEGALSASDDPALDKVCGDKGSIGNMRNTWFPTTAIFVHGGTLNGVRDADRKRLKLTQLTKIEGGEMMVVGKAARDVEWSYVPCVGSQRVEAGHRLDGFLPPGAVLSVKPGKGQAMNLSLPSPTEPYVMLHYRSGEMIPVPMRPVIVSVDLVQRRMVVHYQSTFPVAPALHTIELRAIVAGQGPGEGETRAAFQQRTQAALDDLWRCPVPRVPIEACATPVRKPDPRIFSR